MNQDKNDKHMFHQYSRSDHAALEHLGMHMESAVLCEDFPSHNHNFTEAFFILGGSAVHRIGDRSIPLKRGDVFVVKGDTVHGFSEVADLSIINLMYTPALFTQSLAELQSLPGFAAFFILEPELRQKGTYADALCLSEEALQHVEQLSRFIIQQEQKQEPALNGVLRLTAAALMSFLAAQYNAAFPASHVIPVLVRALDFMEHHLHQEISLEQIAQSACVSPRHLQRLFQNYFHTRPMAYLRQQRLERARILLKNQGLSVAETANECGFSDPAYFARCYKNTFGTVPSTDR